MNISLDAADLQPVIEATIEKVLDRFEEDRAKLNGRIGFTEPEAAALLGIRPHVLADARRRGEIRATLIGKRFIYSRDTLLAFLADDR